MSEKPGKKYYTPAEVAELLMVSPVTVRQLSQKGELEYVFTPGGHRRYLLKHIKSFARQRNIPLSTQPVPGIRILIVDDDKRFTEFLIEVLLNRPETVDIKTTSDGFRAGHLLYTFEPHIVLLDLRIPHIDGFSVCRDIKSEKLTKDIRVIAMSRSCSKDSVKKIIESGAENCLKKPFGPEELFSAIGLHTLELT